MPVNSRKITSSPTGVADNNTTTPHDERELQKKYANIFTTMSEQLKTKRQKDEGYKKDNYQM